MYLRRLTFVVLLLLSLLAVAGCHSTAPAATEVEAPEAGGAEAAGAESSADAALTVFKSRYSVADLESMEQVTVETEGTTYTGVRLLDLLGDAEGTVTLVASDGYSAEIVVADLDDTCILAWNADGGLDSVLPGQDHAGWVRGTVAIEGTGASGGDAAGDAEDEAEAAAPVATPDPNAVFVANGVSFTLEALQAMEQVSIEEEGETYNGVRLLDVLDAAGIDAAGIRLEASDGYSGQVETAALDDSAILAYNDEGGVNTVIPGYDKGAWVKYVISIEPLGAPQAAGPAPTPRTIEGETTTVTDSLGNVVTIPAEVSRVASMRSGITEVICALGECDKLVAVDEMVQGGFSYGEFITRVHPELMELSAPYAGHDLSSEGLLSLDPDLVLHGGYGRIKQAEALMKQVPGLPVVIAHFETMDAYMDDIRIVGTCVDAEERAEELVAYLEGFLASVAERVGDIPEDEKVRVFFGGHEIDHGYTPDTFEHAQIVLAGGVNVMQDMSGWLPDVSAEQLLVWDPEVIVVLNGADLDAIYNNPQVADVSAIKNGRVYALPEAGWDFSSPRALFAIEWLATKLYPERFDGVDIEAEADAFYQAVFGADYEGPALTE